MKVPALFLKVIAPVLADAVPKVREEAPVRVSETKLGVAAVEIPWAVLTTPDATEKLVELNWAIPLPVVEASSMVIVVPVPVALSMVRSPDSPSKELTPEPDPPLKQAPQDKVPDPLVFKQLAAPPSFVGRV